MKKCTIILGSIIGGAILGSTITLCATSEKGRAMRHMAHEKIMAQLEYLQSQMKGCNCSMEGESKMEQMGDAVKEKVAEVSESVKGKVEEMKGKMSM